MAGIKYYGGILRGTAAERAAYTTTNLNAGWIWIETDTNPPLIYFWTGSAWRLFTTKDVTETLTGKTLTSPTINTPTFGAPLSIANGGTSGGTATAGFDALSPMTTLGDVLYGGASGTRTRLAGNITTVRQFLTQTGDGANSAAPAWATPKSLQVLYQSISSATQSVFYTIVPGALITTEANAGLIIDYAFTVKRVRANVSANAKTGSVILQLRDDSADITGALVTITAGTTGPFDSGAISVAVASGSMIDWKYDPTASGTGSISFVAVAELEVTLA